MIFIVLKAIATIAGCFNDHDYNHWPGGPLPAGGQMDPLWKWRLLMNTDGGTQIVQSFKKQIVHSFKKKIVHSFKNQIVECFKKQIVQSAN